MTGTRWDVWLAWVAYEDRPGEGKRRPVVIGGNAVYFVSVYPCTSHAPRGGLDYQLREWRLAGLDRPSVVRLGCAAELAAMSFVHRIGRLSDLDIANIVALLCGGQRP